MPRCYTSPELETATVTRNINVFCDTSEQAYGSGAYLRSEDQQGQVQVTFLLARSRVAPKRQLSIPHLEICAALTEANLPDASQFRTFRELLEVTTLALHGTTGQTGSPSAADYLEAEYTVLRRAQMDAFREEIAHLESNKPVPSHGSLITLLPELDNTLKLICVGGRMRQSEQTFGPMHPIVLDPSHAVTKLIIQKYDKQLCHPGPERVFAQIRRKYWILRGRESVGQHQHNCAKCQQWRTKPVFPRMAYLRPSLPVQANLLFHRNGLFWTFHHKNRTEKRWGIIFKCLTTRSIHLDLLNSIDTDSFLMAMRRFISRRGTPWELLSNQGTNFKGGERELSEDFANLTPTLQTQLAKQKIQFRFNPPNAPHFGGVWEREICSVKDALRKTLGVKTVSEEVLRTVLIEVEGILNSKPLGYVSSDVADPDPVTPNLLLMGRPDSSLTQVTYADNELLSRRSWRHSQVLTDHFWVHFAKCFLPSLQTCLKWQGTVASAHHDWRNAHAQTIQYGSALYCF
ncbi:hypothetical protein SKAU_G00092760 [Synaphobranchus kaupii]|uniref:Integrase catalytic domain-containing protein n=1 Tax=Synaphobranchus kaupii TaxID=118154 RepID=A0A9Q1FWV2_SYNKA|nr:hypothetical protein SKAU_G00092760 [Synaphobranchus kaupii]